MASGIEKVVVEIIGKADSAVKAFGSAGDAAVKFGEKSDKAHAALSKVSGLLKGAVVAGAAAAGYALMDAAKAAASEEQEMAVLANTLRNTTGATDESIAATESWITAQQNATGISDGELRPALSNLVAATKDVGQAQELLTTAMDISVGKGLDLESVTNAMAKAYNGNTGALGKLGIATKDAAGEALSFEEIMANAAATFGGAAATAADTTAGKMAILQAKFADIKETVGAAVIPIIEKLVGVISRLADWYGSLSPTMQGLIPLIGAVALGFGAVAVALGPVISSFASFLPLIAAQITAMGGLAAACTAVLVPALGVLAGVIIGVGIYKLTKDILDGKRAVDSYHESVTQLAQGYTPLTQAQANYTGALLTTAETHVKLIDSTNGVIRSKQEEMAIAQEVAQAWTLSGATTKSEMDAVAANVVANYGTMHGTVAEKLYGADGIVVTNQTAWNTVQVDANWGLSEAETATREKFDLINGTIQTKGNELVANNATAFASVAATINAKMNEGYNQAYFWAGEIAGVAGPTAADILGCISTDLDDLATVVGSKFQSAYEAARAWAVMISSLDLYPAGGWSSGSIGAPHLAEGGVVKASPGGTMVNVGEGGEDEYVIPESKLRRLLGRTGRSAKKATSFSGVPMPQRHFGESGNEYLVRLLADAVSAAIQSGLMSQETADALSSALLTGVIDSDMYRAIIEGTQNGKLTNDELNGIFLALKQGAFTPEMLAEMLKTVADVLTEHLPQAVKAGRLSEEDAAAITAGIASGALDEDEMNALIVALRQGAFSQDMLTKMLAPVAENAATAPVGTGTLPPAVDGVSATRAPETTQVQVRELVTTLVDRASLIHDAIKELGSININVGAQQLDVGRQIAAALVGI
jgi:hypothetical protein